MNTLFIQNIVQCKCFQYKNKYLAANQYIIMISEGSCDAEDWSNDAENSALPHSENYTLKY